MSRAPFQVLVPPVHVSGDKSVKNAIFRGNDADEKYWQGIAGGREGRETPLQAAKREAFEEAYIPTNSERIELSPAICGSMVGGESRRISDLAQRWNKLPWIHEASGRFTYKLGPDVIPSDTMSTSGKGEL